MPSRFFAAGAIVFGLVDAASGQVALNHNDHITESLVAAKAGDIIRNTCASISARFLVVYQKMAELEDYARAQGYTEEEVRVFLKDKAEKARITAMAESYLAQAGAMPDDPESYCQVGRDEIAEGTLVGSLLSSWK